MNDSAPTLSASWQQVFETLPDEVLAGAELCALTPSLDDALAELLLKEAGHTNGTTPRVLREVRCLPFVADFGETFAVSPNVRGLLVRRLEDKEDAFRVGHFVLSRLFHGRYERDDDKDAPEARRLQWNVAYHLAPVEPDAAVGTLDEIVHQATQLHSLSDLRAVVELTTERRDCLTDHHLDILYYEGKLAYEEGRETVAEEKLMPVWTESSDRRKKISSGMYLGQILATPNRGGRWDESVEILEKTARLADEASDERARGMTLNALGALRGRRRAAGDLDKAVEELAESVKLGRRVGNPVTVRYALSGLGSVQMKLGRDKEAEETLRQVIELEEVKGESKDDRRLRRSLGQLLVRKGPDHYDEAAEIFSDGAKAAEAERDWLTLAIYLEGLAEVVRARSGKAGGKEEEDLLKRSVEMGKRAKNLRHLAIVLSQRAQNAFHRNDLQAAEALQKEVVRLNEERKDQKFIRRAKGKLKQIQAARRKK